MRFLSDDLNPPEPHSAGCQDLLATDILFQPAVKQRSNFNAKLKATPPKGFRMEDLRGPRLFFARKKLQKYSSLPPSGISLGPNSTVKKGGLRGAPGPNPTPFFWEKC
jgi:hypothetical protein